MRLIFAAAVLAAASATPALAQDEGNAGFAGAHVEVVGGVDIIRAGGDAKSGGVYGIAGGFDFGGASNIVFGVEAEGTESTLQQCVEGVCLKAGRDLYAGGRAGFQVSDDALIYAKAGYTNFRVKATDGDVSAGTNLDGLRAGAGVEWSTASGMLVKVEYRYSNYEAGVTRHQGVVGLGFRF